MVCGIGSFLVTVTANWSMRLADNITKKTRNPVWRYSMADRRPPPGQNYLLSQRYAAAANGIGFWPGAGVFGAGKR